MFYFVVLHCNQYKYCDRSKILHTQKKIMNTISTRAYDPGPVSSEQGLRNEAKKVRNLNGEENTLESDPNIDTEEQTDYSYDPDDEWIRMHLSKKMEENY